MACRTCGGNEENHCLTVFARNRELRAAWAERDRLQAAVHRCLSVLTARATTVLPPSAMMLAYKLAFDELREWVTEQAGEAQSSEVGSRGGKSTDG